MLKPLLLFPIYFILFVFLRLQLLMQSFYAEKFNCVIYLYFKAHPWIAFILRSDHRPVMVKLSINVSLFRNCTRT